MNGEKLRVPEHHFKQDLMIGVAAIILLLIFLLDKKLNNSKVFNTLLHRPGGAGESAETKSP